jgi:spermidine/putrescine-binding protein
MYSKYEEMQVVRNLLKDWARIDKESYEDIWKNIKENVIPKTPFSIEDFESQQQLAEVMQNLHNIQLGYSSTNNALQELAQATSCYEMGYTQESIQSGTADSIATEREKKGISYFMISKLTIMFIKV